MRPHQGLPLAITASAGLTAKVWGQAGVDFDPGYPVQDPTVSYWQIPTHPDVADGQSTTFPQTADVVIIGSGMSGTSVAWHLLVGDGHTAQTPFKPRIAMLEARQACSGATGRNGGHIRPSSWEEYATAKRVTTKDEAIKITRLRANHTQAIIAAAAKLSPEARRWSSARSVDSLDVFFDEVTFRHAVNATEALKAEIPDVGEQWSVLEHDEAVRVSLIPTAVGALAGTPKLAGAVWGYRFVTSSLKYLLDGFPVSTDVVEISRRGSFSLDTNTPARQVRALPAGSEYNFEVVTDRGVIRTNHVVHASNAWVPHFTVGTGRFIDAMILHMSAQLGGTGLPNVGEWPPHYQNTSLPTGRAWSLFRNLGLDYVVHQPENNEFMFGGGAGLASVAPPTATDPALRYADNVTTMSPIYEAYLGGVLPTYFGYEAYGAERTDYPDNGTGSGIWPGRMKRVWNGVEALTRDALPVVGPLDERFSNRTVLANPGKGREWVTTGFNGEGMAYTWLSGKGLSEMIRNHGGRDNSSSDAVFEWFPRAFLLTEERLKRAAGVAVRDVQGLRRRSH
ncbi:FAD dependent oxidoreductase-domain-containing protein [Microdochium bolleyi]|uniref:FAD dependent oxidoreductase-domain-containing protein n=1 Tax=Microdochium bolleyi TaxID=196109 RepID=A0A136J8A7_9PEZI|nr:FAD dependent oxidoreductase-domain-containing protein [Microdochium bolleyi]